MSMVLLRLILTLGLLATLINAAIGNPIGVAAGLFGCVVAAVGMATTGRDSR